MKLSVIAFVGGLLLLPLVGIAAAWFGLWPSRATSAPSRWETAFAERTLRPSLACYTVDLKNPVIVSDQTILAGMKIFRTNCAGCHGEFGQLSHWGTRVSIRACLSSPMCHLALSLRKCFSSSRMVFVIRAWAPGMGCYQTLRSGKS